MSYRLIEILMSRYSSPIFQFLIFNIRLILIYLKCSPHISPGLCQVFLPKFTFSRSPQKTLPILSEKFTTPPPLSTIWKQRSYATLPLIPLWLVWVLHQDYKLLRIQIGKPTGKVWRKQDGSFFFLGSFDAASVERTDMARYMSSRPVNTRATKDVHIRVSQSHSWKVSIYT